MTVQQLIDELKTHQPEREIHIGVDANPIGEIQYTDDGMATIVSPGEYAH